MKLIPIILIVSFFISCNGYGQTKIDSSKFYWKKKVYWEGRMNKELERLNKGGHANDISRNLVRFQDSAIRYKILLDKLKR